MNKADILLHPVRLRIVQAIAAAHEATAADIAKTLTDVPPASLYRHLNKLLEAELVKVVSSRQARGAERTFSVASSAKLGAEDLEGATAADHSKWFLGFAMGLYEKFERQLQQGSLDFEAEGIGYHTLPLWLSDAELQEVAQKLNETLAPFIENRPDGERRLRNFSTVLMPEPDAPESPE